ncbi:MAG: SusC/RagA family TonB-linked outer membrane protein, partial [Sphingobacteriales bacterium]
MKHLVYILLLISSICLGQDKTITGNVTSEDGLPLPGATVMVAGKPSTAMVTDMHGNYSIKAQAGQQLEFNYVEATKELVIVEEGNVINIELKAEGEEVILESYKQFPKPRYYPST